jgi:hypothetical protein
MKTSDKAYGARRRLNPCSCDDWAVSYEAEVGETALMLSLRSNGKASDDPPADPTWLWY